MTREVAIQIVEIMSFVSIGVFYFGWARITEYSPRVRTIVFWVINILGGIFMLDYIITKGCHISWGYVCLVVGMIVVVFWLAEEHPKHPNAKIRRRGIISFKEDLILFINTLVVWIGIPFVCIQLLSIFI